MEKTLIHIKDEHKHAKAQLEQAIEEKDMKIRQLEDYISEHMKKCEEKGSNRLLETCIETSYDESATEQRFTKLYEQLDLYDQTLSRLSSLHGNMITADNEQTQSRFLDEGRFLLEQIDFIEINPVTSLLRVN
jgi:arginine deiminase